MAKEFLPCIAKRFDLLVLANNHILDQKIPGLIDTINNINQFQVPFVGVGNDLQSAWKAK